MATPTQNQIIKISEDEFFAIVKYDENGEVESVKIYEDNLLIFEVTPTTLTVFSHFAPNRTPEYLTISDNFDELPNLDAEALINGKVSIRDFVKGVLEYWKEVVDDTFSRLLE